MVYPPIPPSSPSLFAIHPPPVLFLLLPSLSLSLYGTPSIAIYVRGTDVFPSSPPPPSLAPDTDAVGWAVGGRDVGGGRGGEWKTDDRAEERGREGREERKDARMRGRYVHIYAARRMVEERKGKERKEAGKRVN